MATTVSYLRTPNVWWTGQRPYERDAITDTIKIGTAFRPGTVTLLSEEGSNQITGVACGRTAGNASDFLRRLTFDFVRELDPIGQTGLLGTLPGNSRHSAAYVFNQGQGTFAPVAGSLILAAAKAVSESNRNAIEEAEAFRRPGQSWTAENSQAAFIYHSERDAIGTAMTIGDFDRSILEEVVVPNAPDHFPTTQVGEDAIIQGDEFLFRDWLVDHRLRLPGAVLRDRSRRRQLTIVNVNRGKIETATGVDLFYYVREFKAFVMVQYKRLSPGPRTFYPNSEKNLQRQLDQMRALGTVTGKATELDLTACRLDNEFLFVKLCDPVQTVRASELSRGIYIGLNWWDAVLASDRTTGDKEGKVLSFQTVPRYLSNTLFCDLVADGWIGSRGVATEKVFDFVEQSWTGGRSIVMGELSLGGDLRRRVGPWPRR